MPSLKVAQFNAVGQTNFIIRGFGNGNGNVGIEGSVGVFIDGVYRSRSAASLNDLPEIERIEVLRGPQSTLFGKNVSAGAISIVTKRPQFDFAARADLTVGNYGQMIAKGTATGPLSKTIAVRLSGTINERDGFYHNIVTSKDVNDRDRGSVRADILWQPSSDLSVRIIGDYNAITERCCGTVQLLNGPATHFVAALAPFGLGAAVSNPATKFDRNIAFNQDPTNRIIGKGISGQIDYDAGFAKFTSISAYRDQLDSGAQDVDFTGDQHMGEQTSTWSPAFDRHRGQGRLDDALAGATAQAWPDVAEDPEAGRDVIELLSHIVPDAPHRAAAIWADAGGRMHYILTRQMIWQWLAIRLGRVTSADDGGRCLGDGLDLGVFETQFELVGLRAQPLGRRAELHAAQLRHLHPELLEFGIGKEQHRL